MDFVTGPDKIHDKNQRFERLVQQHQAALQRACFLYLRDQEQARDAVQEAFLRAYRGWDDFRGDSSEKTWLARIAINVCRDMQKSAWHRFTDRRVTPDSLPAALQPCSPTEEHLVLDVMRLPPKLREVIILRYYHGLTVTDIAAALHITHSTVSGRLQRAERKLKNAWEGGDPL